MPRLHNLLEGVIGELDSLPTRIEERFVGVGSRLHHLSSRLRGISENADAAALLMSAGEASSVIEGLVDTLGRLEKYFIEADSRGGRAVSRLESILDELDRIHRLMAGFMERVDELRMLKLLTSIQSASVAGRKAGFGNVAADIGKLSQNFRLKSTSINDRTRQLQAELRKALTMVGALQNRQKELSGAVTSSIREGIGSMEGMRDKCAGAARDVSERSVGMSHALGNVVVALQFHDITRQQMEHAREALCQVRGEIMAGAGKGAEEAATFSPGDVCALQSAHLANSANELSRAVESMTLSLRAIASESASYSVGAHELFGLAGASGESYIAGIECGLSSVMAVFDENIAASDHLTRIMVSVTSAMGDINAFAEDIEFIGSEIRLIALNAIIKSVQAGKDGAAFGVIAETVKRQSETICLQAGAITDTILNIASHVGALQSDMAAGGNAEPETHLHSPVAEHGLEHSIALLKGLTGRILDHLDRADKGAAALEVEIREAITALDSRQIMTSLSRDVIVPLGRLAVDLRNLHTAAVDAPSAGNLDSHKDRYTMLSERRVHDLFTFSEVAGRGLPGEVEIVSPFPAFAGNGDFGENVEFF